MRSRDLVMNRGAELVTIVQGNPAGHVYGTILFMNLILCFGIWVWDVALVRFMVLVYGSGTWFSERLRYMGLVVTGQVHASR